MAPNLPPISEPKAGLPAALAANGSPIRLTRELRDELRQAVDRRRRELLGTVDPARVAADRAMFADDNEDAPKAGRP